MIRNYTSTVPASKSILAIEKRLVAAGATNIIKNYENKALCGLFFTVHSSGRDLPFKMPARVGQIHDRMVRQVKRPRRETIERLRDQAERTAWKLLAEWVDIQLTLVELGQAELAEIFLPYVYDHKTQSTLYDRISSGELKLLT